MSQACDILQKVERALAEYIIDLTLTMTVDGESITMDNTRVYTGLSRGRSYAQQPQQATLAGRMLVPCIQCVAQYASLTSGTSGPTIGNWDVDATIRVRSNASDTYEEDHRAIVGRVFHEMLNPAMPQNLQNVGQVLGVMRLHSFTQSHDVEDDSYVSEIGFVVAALDLPIGDQPLTI